MRQFRVVFIKNYIGIFLKYFIVTFMSVLALYPFLWVINSGFKNNQEIILNSFSLPTVWRIENYTRAFLSNSMQTGFRNSIIVTSSVLVMVTILGSMVSYVLARVVKSKLLYLYFTIGIMVPMTSILIPVFMLLRNIGLLNTLMGLMVVYTSCQMSITVFILTGFLRNIPWEIEEAAIIDGMGYYGILFRIVLPYNISIQCHLNSTRRRHLTYRTKFGLRIIQ